MSPHLEPLQPENVPSFTYPSDGVALMHLMWKSLFWSGSLNVLHRHTDKSKKIGADRSTFYSPQTQQRPNIAAPKHPEQQKRRNKETTTHISRKA